MTAHRLRPDVLEAARARELGELQSAPGDHDSRRTTPQQHRQDRASRVAGPRRPCVGAGRCCAPQRSCSTLPTAFGRSAARATSPFRCSRSAGRRLRRRRCTSPGSMLDALRRGLRGDFRGARGPNRAGAHGDRVGAAGLDPPPQRDVAAVFRGAAARGAGRRLRGDRRTVAAGRRRRSWSACRPTT